MWNIFYWFYKNIETPFYLHERCLFSRVWFFNYILCPFTLFVTLVMLYSHRIIFISSSMSVVFPLLLSYSTLGKLLLLNNYVFILLGFVIFVCFYKFIAMAMIQLLSSSSVDFTSSIGFFFSSSLTLCHLLIFSFVIPYTLYALVLPF
jgi:hypothetical protein